MDKCDNCDAQATYIVKNPGANSQNFCVSHLPWFLNENIDYVKKLEAKVEKIVEVVKEKVTPKKKAADASTKNSDEAGASSSEDSSQS